jgi:hypothetical protein
MSAAFLSYARVDGRDEADHLFDDLSAAHKRAWVDRYNLRVGDDWGPEIEEAIRKAEAFILLLTPGAVASPEVKREYEEALRLKKDVLPILIKQCEIPTAIHPINYLDLTSADRHAFARLLGDLDGVWDKVTEALAQLVTDTAVGPAFGPLVNKLTCWAEQRGKLEIPPEVYRTFADLITRMNADAQPARDLRTLVDELLDNRYLDQSWPLFSVFQAHREFFNKQLREWQTSLPNQPVAERVPIVLLVMTRHEALDLQSGAAFQNETEEVGAFFASLKARVEADTATVGWVDRYADAREDWKPYEQAGASLASLVQEELANAGKDFEPPKPFVAKFISIQDLVESNSRAKLRDLRENGCVVIMDVLSICHPAIHSAYRRSLLDAYSKTFLVKVGPLIPLANFQQELTFRVSRRLDLEFSDRLELDRDPRCRKLPELVDLRNYIYNEIWAVTPETAWPPKGPRAYWMRRTG